MKKLLFIVLLPLSIAALAQQEKLAFKIGDEYRRKLTTIDLAFLGDIKTGIVNVSLDAPSKKLYLTRFDPETLNQTSEQKIDLDEGLPGKYQSELVTTLGKGNYYWIFSGWEGNERVENLYYDKINVATGTLDMVYQPLISASKMAYKFLSPDDKYKFFTNSNNSRLLVTYRLMPEKRNDKKNYDVMGMHVFDADMHKLWGDEFTLPYTEAKVNYLSYSVDAIGNAYLLAKVVETEKGASKYPRFEILQFSAGMTSPEIIPFEMPTFNFHHIWMLEGENGEIMVGGNTFKTDGKKGDYSNGVFVGILDKTKKAVVNYKQGFYPFPLKDLQQFISEKDLRKVQNEGDAELEWFHVKNIVVEKNGAVLFTGEAGYSRLSSNSSSGKFWVYYSDDIYALRIDENGKTDWMRKIPKKQINTDEMGPMGSALIKGKQSYFLVYCDNKKNFNIKPDEEPELMKKFGRNSDVVAAVISKEGVQSKQALFDTKEEDLRVMPTELIRLDENIYVSRVEVNNRNFRPLLIRIIE